MEQQNAADMLKEILAGSENPQELLQQALGNAAAESGNAQQQLNLLIAADPNVATYLRSSMPSSVNEHQRYEPTVEVTFKDGSFGGGAVSISASDFDEDLHEKAGEEAKEEKKTTRQRSRSS